VYSKFLTVDVYELVKMATLHGHLWPASRSRASKARNVPTNLITAKWHG